MAGVHAVAAKPKLKKADPASRSWCKELALRPPARRLGRVSITCQNVTLAEFADRLQGMGPDWVRRFWMPRGFRVPGILR